MHPAAAAAACWTACILLLHLHTLSTCCDCSPLQADGITYLFVSDSDNLGATFQFSSHCILLGADGITYLFVSNSDNLGATLDLDLLAYFARTDKGFLMEASRVVTLLGCLLVGWLPAGTCRPALRAPTGAAGWGRVAAIVVLGRCTWHSHVVYEWQADSNEKGGRPLHVLLTAAERCGC